MSAEITVLPREVGKTIKEFLFFDELNITF
jgi:hypothetical protein